jgi:hypothetical protein
MEWVNVCKRTEDPKLAWIENRLDALGIEHRRGNGSWHASATLEVPEDQEMRFWEFIGQPAPARYRRWYKTLDDMPDDHKIFQYDSDSLLWG